MDSKIDQSITHFDVVIIGSGIAAISYLWQLSENLSAYMLQNLATSKIKKILVLSQSDWAPPCSLNSTAIAAKRGISKGISALGDLLWQGQEYLWHHYQQQLAQLADLQGLEPITCYYHPEAKASKRVGASELGLMFYPEKFLTSLTAICCHRLAALGCEVIFKHEFIYNIDAHFIQLQSGVNIHFVHVALFPGAYVQELSWSPGLLPDEVVQNIAKKGQSVYGSYVEGTCHLNCGSFAYYAAEKNGMQRSFIYRSQDHKVLIGTYSQKESFLLTEQQSCLLRDDARNLLLEVMQKFKLPNVATPEWVLKTGRRHKLAERKPIFGHSDIKHDATAVNSRYRSISYSLGGYKNGYSIAFYVAHQLAQALMTKIFEHDHG